MKRQKNERGWVLSEVLFAGAVMVALSISAYIFLAKLAERGATNSKAAWASTEIVSFMFKPRLPRTRKRDLVLDNLKVVAIGGSNVATLPACALDPGDSMWITPPVDALGVVQPAAEVIRCAPCTGYPGPLGSVGCGTPPARCPTLAGHRASLGAMPGASQLMQGIWLPADSLGEALMLRHLVATSLAKAPYWTDPTLNDSTLNAPASWMTHPYDFRGELGERLSISHSAAGLLICL